MANLALTVERKAFSVAIDAALKSLNKDREKGLLQIVDLTEKFMGDNFRKEAYDGVRKNDPEPGSQMDALCQPSVRRDRSTRSKNDRIKPWFSGCILRNQDHP